MCATLPKPVKKFLYLFPFNHFILIDGIKCGLRKVYVMMGTKCIYEWDFCNGEVNCDDGSDEKASRCLSVTTGKCVRLALFTIISSRTNVGNQWYYLIVAPTTEFACGNNEYKCNNASKCINKTKICDTNSDCPGGDDEVSCCKYLHLYTYIYYFVRILIVGWLCSESVCGGQIIWICPFLSNT